MIRVLGIDPGYDRLGIAILEGTRETHALLHSECFETGKNLPFAERLHAGIERIVSVIDQFSPDVIALETLFFSNNQKTAMHVAEVRGALLYVAQNANCQIQEFAPQQVKSAVAGSGRGSKEDVAAMLHHLIEIPDKKMRDDEYDAIAVALTALVSHSR
ncbi:MAG: crossover junction endodeoxyribonuclease RuvC [Patescibacteria group bacterium]